jgi:hypothetical protein
VNFLAALNLTLHWTKKEQFERCASAVHFPDLISPLEFRLPRSQFSSAQACKAVLHVMLAEMAWRGSFARNVPRLVSACPSLMAPQTDL